MRGSGHDVFQGGRRAHVVGAAGVARHDDAVELQGAFEQVHGPVGADFAARDEGDAAIERGVNDVIHLEQVAQHDVNDFAHGRIFKLEGAHRAGNAGGVLRRTDDFVGSVYDDGLALLAGFIAGGGLRGGRAGGLGRGGGLLLHGFQGGRSLRREGRMVVAACGKQPQGDQGKSGARREVMRHRKHGSWRGLKSRSQLKTAV